MHKNPPHLIPPLSNALAILVIVAGILSIGESLFAQAAEHLLPQLRFENSGTVTRDIDFRYFTQPDDYLENPDLWNIRSNAMYLYRVDFLYYRSHSLRQLTEKDTVVLADFANTTGESVFDNTLKQALRVQLEQSPFLNVLSEQQVSQQLRYMGRPANERLTQDVARELCQRASSKAVLAGSISSLGSHYAIGLTSRCRAPRA
jgi:hypothetical protein